MLFLYTFFFHLGFILSIPYMALKAAVSPSYRAVLLHRLGFVPGPEVPVRIWFHCSSVGEAMALGPLLARVKDRVPLKEIALSTMTRTGMGIAQRSYPGIGSFFFLPYDLPWAVSRMLNTLRPGAIAILETEFWPNMLNAAKKRGIPVLLVNGRISARSIRWYRRLPGLFGPALQACAAAGMQSEDDRGRLLSLGVAPQRAQVTGNLKFDILEHSVTQTAANGVLEKILKGSELIIAGSTHRGEEEIILTAFRDVLRMRPSARLLLAPRHIERSEEIASLAGRMGFRCVRRTELDDVSGEKMVKPIMEEVILLDTLGELAGLYSYGRAIFVGGSLVPQGGHNVLEPALAGKAVLFGPHMEAFKEARDILLSSGGGTVVRDAGEIQDEMNKALNDPGDYQRRGALAREAILKRRGAAQKNFALLEKYV